jgi:hypothetical protein
MCWGMKKWTLSITAILLLFMFSSVFAKNDDKTIELSHIIKVLENSGAEPKDWKIHFRGQLGFASDTRGYLKQAEELMRRWPKFSWAISENNTGHIKMTGRNTLAHLGFTETITVITYPQNENQKPYFIYAAEGPVYTNLNWIGIQNHINDRIDDSIGGNPRIFSCATGTYGDKMMVDLYLQANELVESFSAVPVEELKEETFVSLSAYTEQWEQAIYTGQNQKMNLQVALRSEGFDGETTVTVGTPIITSEY